MPKRAKTPEQETTTVEATLPAELVALSHEIHKYAALLNGINSICKADDHGPDVLFVAGHTADTINTSLCVIADRLSHLAEQGETA